MGCTCGPTSRLPGSTSTQACTSLLSRGGRSAKAPPIPGAGTELEPAPPGAWELGLAPACFPLCAGAALALALLAVPKAAVPDVARSAAWSSWAGLAAGLRGRSPKDTPMRGERGVMSGEPELAWPCWGSCLGSALGPPLAAARLRPPAPIPVTAPARSQSSAAGPACAICSDPNPSCASMLT